MNVELKKRQALLEINDAAHSIARQIIADRKHCVDRLDRLWKICVVANQKIQLAKNFDNQSLEIAVHKFKELMKNL